MKIGVAPAPPALLFPLVPSGSSGPLDEGLLFEIVASGSLPVLDISRSIRTVVFSEQNAARIHQLIAKNVFKLFVGYNIAFVLIGIGLLGSAHTGRCVAIPMFLISFSAPVTQFLMMRYELILLLLQTYDFWFFSSIWLATIVLFAVSLGDLRILILVVIWMGLQVNIMVDAATSYRGSIYLTAVGLFLCIIMISSMALGVIDEMQDFVLVTINGYTLSSQDAIINGWSTCLLVLVRTLYRRRAALRDHRGNKTVVQCVSYRCRVRLRARTRLRRTGSSVSSAVSSVGSVSSVGHMTRVTASYFQNARSVQMRCMRVKIKFSERNLVAPFARHLIECADNAALVRSLRVGMLTLLQVGFALTIVSFHPEVPRMVRCAALATTVAFTATSLCISDRQLLKYLIFSFDFAFLSLQLTITHVALCDLYQWDSRALFVACMWLWAHWVITFDCIAPVLKNKLRLRYRFVVWVAVLFVVAHVMLVHQFVVDNHDTFQDRSIFTVTVGQRTFTLRVLPLLVSRLLMTFGWSCRIVWRLAWRHESELIMIQGTVTYINNRRLIKEQEARFKANPVLERTKSIALQMARRVTRRFSAFGPGNAATVAAGVAVNPVDPPTNPVSERSTRYEDSANSDAIATASNPRLANILTSQPSFQLGVKPMGASLQHQPSLGVARAGMMIFDASACSPPAENDRRNEVVPLRETHQASLFKMLPRDTDSYTRQMQRLVVLQKAPGTHVHSKSSDGDDDDDDTEE